MNLKSKNIALGYSFSHFKSLIVSLLLIINLFSFPAVSNAGVISFVSDILVGKDASAQSEQFIESSNVSSPMMDLPEPAINFNPVAKIEKEIIIDGGVALLTDGEQSVLNSAEIDSNYSKNQISVYTVREGDTLSKIANMYDISVSTILWANDMNKN